MLKRSHLVLWVQLIGSIIAEGIVIRCTLSFGFHDESPLDFIGWLSIGLLYPFAISATIFLIGRFAYQGRFIHALIGVYIPITLLLGFLLVTQQGAILTNTAAILFGGIFSCAPIPALAALFVYHYFAHSLTQALQDIETPIDISAK